MQDKEKGVLTTRFVQFMVVQGTKGAQPQDTENALRRIVCLRTAHAMHMPCAARQDTCSTGLRFGIAREYTTFYLAVRVSRWDTMGHFATSSFSYY